MACAPPIGPGIRRISCPIDRGLRVHPEIAQVRHKPLMPRRLIRAAHHAKGHGHAAILGQHAGDDRVHGAFAAAEFVGMPLFQRKARAAVLQQHAEFLGGNARAETVEDGVDQRHCHAVAVDYGDVNRVAVHRLGKRFGGGHGALGINQRGQFRCRFRREHIVKFTHVIGVGDKAVARVIGQFGGLGLDMHTLCAKRVHACNIEMFQDVEQQDGGGALAVWRMLDQVGTFVIAADGRCVIAALACEIGSLMGAAQGIERGDDVVGHFAFVIGGASVAGDAAQHLGLAGGAEHLARLEGRTRGHEMGEAMPLKCRACGGPVKGHAGGHWHALFGVAY